MGEAMASRPRWRLSVRTFLVVTLLFGVLSGVAVRWGLPALAQWRAVREIEALGGLVVYDDEEHTGRTASPSVRRRMYDSLERKQELLGHPISLTLPVELEEAERSTADTLLRGVRSFNVHGAKFNDDDLQRVVRRLPELRDVDIGQTQVTDSGLSHLLGLKELEALRLHKADISDDGLGRLKGLDKLTILVLSGTTRITDEGLVHLKSFKHLKFLELGGLEITDEGLRHIRELPELKILSLIDTSVTPRGIEELKAARPGLEVVP